MTDDADRNGSWNVWLPLLRVGKVLIPSTFLASLFFYFGLRYADYHYRQYGVDDAALGFSATDYVLRSLNVTIEPLRAVVLVALGAVLLHLLVRASTHLVDRGGGSGRDMQRAIGFVFLALGLIGLVAYWSGNAGPKPLATTRWWLASVVAIG